MPEAEISPQALALTDAAIFVRFLEGIDLDTMEAVIAGRVRQQNAKRSAVAFTVSEKLQGPERSAWLDWTNEAYNAGSQSLQSFGRRATDTSDYMNIYAICREALLGIFARHLATVAEFELLTAPVRPYFKVLERT